MTEFQRLLREMQAAQTPTEAHAVLQLSLTSELNNEERKQLLAAKPQHLRESAAEPDSVLAAIRCLMAINVQRGIASKWSQSTPWRDNPWQLIQVSASRALAVLVETVPATIRGPLQTMARAIATATAPDSGWLEICKLAAAEPPAAGNLARGLAARCIMAAWTTLNEFHRPESQVIAKHLRTILPIVAGPVSEVELAGLASQAVGTTLLGPEQALGKLKSKSPRLQPALPEILAAVAVYQHMRNATEAEAWLNAMLTRD